MFIESQKYENNLRMFSCHVETRDTGQLQQTQLSEHRLYRHTEPTLPDLP